MKIRTIYTFGSPRILSPEAAEHAENVLFPNQIYRHVNSRDVLSAIPPKYLSSDQKEEIFDHAGLIVIYDRDELRFGPGPWSRAKERFRAILDHLDNRGPAAMEAHLMSRYNAAVYEQYRRNSLPRPNGWNPATALSCARASRLVYQGPVRQALPLLGFQEARLVVGLGLEVLIVLPQEADDSSDGLIAFSGKLPEDSLDFRQWRQIVASWQSNVLKERVPWYPGAPGFVDAAWLEEVVEIELTLKDAIERFCGGRAVVVTGHGKGGAQALIWAMRHLQGERGDGPAAERPLSQPGKKADFAPAAEPLPEEPTGTFPFQRHDSEEGDWRNPLSYAEVGSRIRQLRQAHGLTQTELANLIGHEQSHISRIEKGEYRVHLETLLAVLGELNVPLSEFFDEPARDGVTPGDLKMLSEISELNERDRASVESLLEFLRQKRTDK